MRSLLMEHMQGDEMQRGRGFLERLVYCAGYSQEFRGAWIWQSCAEVSMSSV